VAGRGNWPAQRSDSASMSAMATLRKESSFVSFKTRISLFNSLSIAAFFPPQSPRGLNVHSLTVEASPTSS
jgi:hypothetical protein